MSVDPKQPFGPFLLAVIREARRENPAGVSEKMWIEVFERAHVSWHDARKKKKAKSAPATSEAARIYALYPRKVARASAVKAIDKALEDVPFETLEASVITYAAVTSRWSKADRAFIPHAATWFNEERWLDDPAEWNRPGMTPAPRPAAPALPPIPEPKGWRDLVLLEWSPNSNLYDEAYLNHSWASLTRGTQENLAEYMAKASRPGPVHD